MHGSRAEAGRLIGELISIDAGGGAAEVVVCPPFVYLADAGQRLRGSLHIRPRAIWARGFGQHTIGRKSGRD